MLLICFLLLSSTRRRGRYCPPFPYWQGDACTRLSVGTPVYAEFQACIQDIQHFLRGGAVFFVFFLFYDEPTH